LEPAVALEPADGNTVLGVRGESLTGEARAAWDETAPMAFEHVADPMLERLAEQLGGQSSR
jgi:hypothetical protein